MPEQTSRTAPAFSYNAHYELLVTGYCHAALSIPALGLDSPLQTKDLLATGPVSADGKATEQEHLQHLQAIGALDVSKPLMVLGARNNLVNLRCPVILNGQVHAVSGEEPSQSRRPYYGLGFKHQRFICDSINPPSFDAYAPDDFFCAGIPVLWDDITGERLLDLMLCEAADHSHVFNLPRGNHPNATDVTRHAWASLHEAFTEHLYAELPIAVAAIHGVLNELPPLRRCDDYFHAIYGVRDDGALVCLFAQGRLEALGNIMKQRGCRRAVCLENSGSIMPSFLPKGLAGDSIPLVRAPNFRARGRGLIAIELINSAFSSIPFIGVN